MPQPDNIPDMSLPERSDQPPRSHDSPDLSSSYQHEKEPATRAPVEPASLPEWQEGDRVLAPWEPMFLYPGTIAQIKVDDARGDQALIEYDDGGEDWVFLYSICPREIKCGQQVQSRRNNGVTYFAAEILEVDGDDVRIRFDEGGSEWTTLMTLRIPCIENGPGAIGTNMAPWQPPNAGAPSSSGIPSWVIWIGISILLAFVRIACREMGRN